MYRKHVMAVGVALVALTLLMPETAQAGLWKKDKAQQDDTKADGGHWWKFWGRDKPQEPEYTWKGWPRGGLHQKTGQTTTSPVDVKVRKHAKPGQVRTMAPHMAKKQRADVKPQPVTGKARRVNKRYEKETYDHRPGTYSKGSSKRHNDLRRNYMLNPGRTQKHKSRYDNNKTARPADR